MIKRSSAVAVSCFVFMCGNAARADLIPFDPSDLKKEPSKAKNKEADKKDKESKDAKHSEDHKEPAK